MQTISQFAAKYNITMSVEHADTNPNMMAADDKWMRDAQHYKCVLTYKRRKMTVPFSCGSAIEHGPTVEDVLNCLISDASSTDYSFEEWCREFGYDTDSRKAEQIYKICQTQSVKLQRLLGASLYAELDTETERL